MNTNFNNESILSTESSIDPLIHFFNIKNVF